MKTIEEEEELAVESLLWKVMGVVEMAKVEEHVVEAVMIVKSSWLWAVAVEVVMVADMSLPMWSSSLSLMAQTYCYLQLHSSMLELDVSSGYSECILMLL